MRADPVPAHRRIEHKVRKLQSSGSPEKWWNCLPKSPECLPDAKRPANPLTCELRLVSETTVNSTPGQGRKHTSLRDAEFAQQANTGNSKIRRPNSRDWTASHLSRTSCRTNCPSRARTAPKAMVNTTRVLEFWLSGVQWSQRCLVK